MSICCLHQLSVIRADRMECCGPPVCEARWCRGFRQMKQRCIGLSGGCPAYLPISYPEDKAEARMLRNLLWSVVSGLVGSPRAQLVQAYDRLIPLPTLWWRIRRIIGLFIPPLRPTRRVLYNLWLLSWLEDPSFCSVVVDEALGIRQALEPLLEQQAVKWDYLLRRCRHRLDIAVGRLERTTEGD